MQKIEREAQDSRSFKDLIRKGFTTSPAPKYPYQVFQIEGHTPIIVFNGKGYKLSPQFTQQLESEGKMEDYLEKFSSLLNSSELVSGARTARKLAMNKVSTSVRKERDRAVKEGYWILMRPEALDMEREYYWVNKMSQQGTNVHEGLGAFAERKNIARLMRETGKEIETQLSQGLLRENQ